jgi:THAP4-like, heme-binding beta-barrel domain
VTEPDASDLRAGPPIHDALLALLPLVGVWRGTGTGVAPSGEKFNFGQWLSFVHDGRPFLVYESRAWIVDDTGLLVRQAWRESGFWRLGAGPDDVEVVLASNTGEALVYAGTAGDQQWEMTTLSAVGTPTAKVVDAEHRLYALVDDDLAYASDLATLGRPTAPHLNARLKRMRSTS